MSALQRLRCPILSIAPLAAAAFALGGCGSYSSDYAPLEDGRARAVYRNDNLVVEIGGDISPACAEAVADPQGSSGTYVHTRSGGRVWVPIYFGPRIVVHGTMAPGPRRSYYTGSRPSFPGPRAASSGGGGGISSSGSGGGGGGGGADFKEAAVILVVIALVALPAVALGLALGRPEPEQEVSEVIDRVNLYNDLSRTPGSPCYLYAPPAQAQAGRPQ